MMTSTRDQRHLLIPIVILSGLFLITGCGPGAGHRRSVPPPKKERVSTSPSPGKYDLPNIHKPESAKKKSKTYGGPNSPETADPRMVASLSLASKGETYIREGRYDEAITVLERSVSLHSANGKSYFYLAEAFLKKGNIGQAREFNRLAGRYLKDDDKFAKLIINQHEQIENYGANTH